MKGITLKFIIILILSCNTIYSQVVQYPSNITLPKLQQLNDNVLKISAFPFYADNTHPMPRTKTGQLWAGEFAGIDLQNKVPTVCLDDFRYGHKFDNPIGANGIGYLSLEYWLPSNGNYLLFYYVLEDGADYYREFLVTTTLSGVYIDHLLVRDGWYDDPREVNFTQAQLNSDLSLIVTEIRDLSASKVDYSSLTTFPGQKVVSNYRIISSGKFVLETSTSSNQRNFSISELHGVSD